MTKYRWWTVVTVAVLLLTLLSVQQTGAFWRGQTATTGAAIRSGELKILAAGSASYPWNNFGGENLTPGSVVQKPLTVSVAGDTKAQKSVYRLQSITASSADVPLVFSAWIVTGADGCPATGNPVGILAGPWTSFPAPSVSRSLDAGKKEVWCLRATVGANAPQNKKTTATFSFRVDQTI